MTFTAVLERLVTEETGYRLFLKEIAPKDEEMPAFMQGVILNARLDQVAEADIPALEPGVRLEVDLVAQPIMTMSLPPQIPGNSILAIHLAEA